ncbi:MAG: hypothetical protein CML24_12230 [Rhizobiales bacterium]|nr:hypothetical protein [Hyphomicrobiales bacterium]
MLASESAFALMSHSSKTPSVTPAPRFRGDRPEPVPSTLRTGDGTASAAGYWIPDQVRDDAGGEGGVG